MSEYKVSIVEASRELSAKQRVLLKDLTNCIKLDEKTKEAVVIIDIDFYAVLDIHNENSKDTNYKKYVVVDKSGQKYVTGSNTFYNAMLNIIEEMEGSEEEYQIQAYRVPSRNYQGKEFITCSILWYSTTARKRAVFLEKGGYLYGKVCYNKGIF